LTLATDAPTFNPTDLRRKGEPMTDTAAADPVHDWIAKSVAENPVILFMKGVPEQPQCGFSAVSVQILDHLGVDFVGVDVLQSDALRQGIKSFSDWPTIPQLYVKGEFVGGCDIIREMFQSGELKTLLEEQGVLAA
jgi:monothiol glutaredoxin